MKGMKIVSIFILVVLFGCVVYASILDKVDSLTVLKDDKCSGVTVQTGVLKSRGEKVVLKIFQSDVNYIKEKAIERGKKEYQALMEIDSSYVIKAIEEEHDGKYMFIEEYFDGCTIDNLPWKSYDVRDVYEILSQFGEGIDAIHKNEIVHNDLHIENLMIGNDNTQDIRVKIIDLDNCKSLGGVYVKCVDWERFGVSMYELFTGQRIQSKGTSPSVSYLELQNLDSRLSSLVDALCISKSIKTYDDYLKELRSHDWNTDEKLLIGMKDIE